MKSCNLQRSLFDFDENYEVSKIIDGKKYNTNIIQLPDFILQKLNKYNLDQYVKDVEIDGLEKTWDYICQYVIDYNRESSDFLNVDRFGELYEIGLAIQDKNLKKKSGQYYTPDDVAIVMAKWLQKSKGSVVCDVACGTGKLILTYLDLIGYEEARKLISSGKLYLYDFDNVALKICRTTIAIKYGLDVATSIHDVFCDFLDCSIELPDDCKVISNPPYAQIDLIQEYWEHTDVLMDTRELYSSFMEKIFNQAMSTVIITPFSFLSGNKFYSLRKEMSKIGYGFVVSFDNVPGNIFCGRKHGIFNTNTANSVRAAITVLYKSEEKKGFRISPLIRFKNEERKRLLDIDLLESSLPNSYQIVDSTKKQFEKVEKGMYSLFSDWEDKSQFKTKDLLSKQKTPFLIDMPNTCRYYTTASARKLNRTGSITMYVKTEREFNFLYCFINSSFTYWWWRVYDGGIIYPIGLLNAMPIPINLLTSEDDAFFATITKTLMDEEKKYIVTKMNAGVLQENIKFPARYRELINKRIVGILGSNLDVAMFDKIHSNCYF